MIKIKQTGFYAHFVDSGRQHMQKNGYSQSGALDWLNFELSNALCANPLSHPAIEVMGGGFECLVEQGCLVSITGANADIYVNDERLNTNCVVFIEANSTLKIEQIHCGWVNYIAFAAHLELPLFGHSVCAVKREKIGGLHQDGEALAINDRIKGRATHFSHVKKAATFKQQLSDHLAKMQAYISSVSKPITTHCLSNEAARVPFYFTYQATAFSYAQRALFLASDYLVSSQSNRMGMRLEGQTIRCDINTLSSQAIANGSVQIAGNGLPIVMRNDRQTIGGYPIIGTVSTLGLACLAHSTPGQKLRFVESNIEEGRQQYLLAKVSLNAIKTSMIELAKAYTNY